MCQGSGLEVGSLGKKLHPKRADQTDQPCTAHKVDYSFQGSHELDMYEPITITSCKTKR